MSKIELNLGDCVEGLKGFPDKHFDLAIVDPPYRDQNSPVRGMVTHGGKMDDFGKKPRQDYFDELFRVSKNQIIWGANNFLEYLPSTNCFIFWNKSQPAPRFSDGELAWTSFGSVARCFDYSIHKHNQTTKIHPTQKPVPLYEWLLLNYAKEGQTILDTHLGSGSIAVACHNLDFDLTAFEQNKKYLSGAAAWLEEHRKQGKLF